MLGKFSFKKTKSDRGATLPEYAIVFAIMVGVALSTSSCLEIVTSLQSDRYAYCISENPPPAGCIASVASSTTTPPPPTSTIPPTTTTTVPDTTTTTAPPTTTTTTSPPTTTTTAPPTTTTTVNPNSMEAEGGLIVDAGTDPTYRFHIFTKTGANTFNVTRLGETGQIEALLVGGGGAGGGGARTKLLAAGGGGGAGSIMLSSVQLPAEGPYRIDVAAGGQGATQTTGRGGSASMMYPESLIGQGWSPLIWAISNSTIGYGGGGGGGGKTETSLTGKNGGSGGGGGMYLNDPTVVNNVLQLVSGQEGKKGLIGLANDGSRPTFYYLIIAIGLAGGGGGGAGGPATNNDNPAYPGWNDTGRGGNGGPGVNLSTFLLYSKTAAVFSCGGAGAGWIEENDGSGNAGCSSGGKAVRGGTADNLYAAKVGFSGGINSGSGGGAALYGQGGNGGSGIVVIRYPIS